MKNLYIADGLEYRCTIPGDVFRQGDLISCAFAIKNSSSKAVNLPSLRAIFCYGDLEKLNPSALSLLSEQILTKELSLNEKEEVNAETTFRLPLDAPTSEKGKSVVLYYGTANDLNERNRLLVNVLPHRYLQEVIEVLGSSFGFTAKGTRYKSGFVEIKCKPSADKRFSLVDELALHGRVSENTLELIYNFKVKSLQTSATSVKVQKGTKAVEQKLSLDRLRLTESQLDLQKIEHHIAEILEQVSAGF